MVTQLSLGSVFYRVTVLAITAVVIATVISLATIGFIESVDWLNDVLLVSPRTRIQVQQPQLLVLATILVPTLGGLLVGILIQRFSVDKRALGPPDAIRAVQLRVPTPMFRSGVVSTLASVVSLGCGASVGQYGPLVYMGAMASNLTASLTLRIPNIQAIAIACGVSAAISTAFNAPIAGLVFAHEVILRHYSLQAFAPTTVASATGFVIANVIFERPALFLVEFSGVSHGYEFVLFAVLGILCAFLAVGFMRLTLLATDMAASMRLPVIWRPAVAGLSVGLVALVFPDVLGVGRETLRFATIEGAFASWELVLLVLMKTGLTAICIGFGFAGGIFSPALLIGILFGALSWTLLELTGIPNSGVVVYAISGMMALTSPIIGAPLTTILIVFELTRNYDLTIAAMMGVVFSNLLTYRLFGRSMFDVLLARRGVDLSSGRDQAMLQHVRVMAQPVDNFICCFMDEDLSIVIKRLQKAGRSEAAVIDENGYYQGVLRLQDAISHSSGRVSIVVKRDWLQFEEHTSLWQAMCALEGFVGEAIPIVSSSNKLVGLITEAEIVASYLKTVHGLRCEENEAI